jgi:hypothetical protein
MNKIKQILLKFKFDKSLAMLIVLMIVGLGVGLSFVQPAEAATPAGCIWDTNKSFGPVSGQDCATNLLPDKEAELRAGAYYLVVDDVQITGDKCQSTSEYEEITKQRFEQIRDDPSTYQAKSPARCNTPEALVLPPVSSGNGERINIPTGEKNFQCGNGPDAVKVSFNFGCVGKNWNGNLNPIVDMFFGIIRALTNIVGALLVIMVIVAGIRHSVAQGDPQATKKAVDMIRNAVIGLIVYMFAFALLQWLVPGGIFD